MEHRPVRGRMFQMLEVNRRQECPYPLEHSRDPARIDWMSARAGGSCANPVWVQYLTQHIMRLSGGGNQHSAEPLISRWVRNIQNQEGRRFANPGVGQALQTQAWYDVIISEENDMRCGQVLKWVIVGAIFALALGDGAG